MRSNERPGRKKVEEFFHRYLRYTEAQFGMNAPAYSASNLEKGKKKIAAREFRVWSPTTLLGLALSSLTTVDRTGNGAFC